jgi:membrane-bound lytic murein transglycosylase B
MPLLMQGSSSLQAAGLSCERDDVSGFATRVAERNGLDRAAVCELFDAATVRADVLRLIVPAPVSRPPDWSRYRNGFIDDRRRAVRVWSSGTATAACSMPVARDSGVPPAVIVALLGVETAWAGDSGRHQGVRRAGHARLRVPPRAAFLREELESLLVLARDQGIAVADIRSSYAGALGMPQFMPGSWRRYAVDGDGGPHRPLAEPGRRGRQRRQLPAAARLAARPTERAEGPCRGLAGGQRRHQAGHTAR